MDSTLDDVRRRADLRRMKLLATGLLVVAAVVFVFARIQEESNHSWGYLRATAEAAMVGALADWFAVTALFRHPLGIPIPHTAIIKKRKDQIGTSLGGFVRDNFLSREVVTERLHQAELGRRLGGWLAQPEHARTVGDQSAVVVKGVTEVLSDHTVQAGLEELVHNRLRSLPVAPIAGRAIDAAIEGQHHQVLLDATLGGLRRFLHDNQAILRRKLHEESPWWVPGQIDDVVYDKIHDVLTRFIAELADQHDHPLRVELDARTRRLSDDLKADPELIDKGEKLKEELLTHPEVRAWTASLWSRIKAGLIEATENPRSELRLRLDQALADAGHSIESDPETRAKIETWITDAVGYVAEQFREEVADLISTTVERWDADETADRLELQVGRDLQFIRINGTIVGGLAGLAIHTLSELLIG
jgi:uncharacterized membrane-anchored protein YjiN (DUF445 family)